MSRSQALLLRLVTTLLLAAAPATAQTARTRLLDVTAGVLDKGEWQVDLVPARFSWGVAEGLQLSTSGLALVTGTLNLGAKLRVVDRPELALALEAGAYWNPVAQGFGLLVAGVPLEAHATVPLSGPWSADLAGLYRWFKIDQKTPVPGGVDEQMISVQRLRAEVSVLRYDDRGAFVLQLLFPLLSSSGLISRNSRDRLAMEGSFTADDLGAWGVMLGRDHVVGQSTHLRAWVGYRNRPGVSGLDSFGRLLLQANVSWR